MNQLQLLKGEPLRLTKDVSVKHPTLGDVIDVEHYEDYVSIMTTTSDDVADIMWHENKMLYTDIKSEWSFFIQKAIQDSKGHDVSFVDNNIEYVQSDCVFVNEDYRDAFNYFFSLDCEYIVMTVNKTDKVQITLHSVRRESNRYIYHNEDFQLTEIFYYQILEYLRQINDYRPDYFWKSCPTKKGKKMLLEQAYRQRESRRKNKRNQSISLGSIVSALIARGQRYKDIWDYPIYMIYDLYKRLSKVDEYHSTMQALYTGNIDTKKHPVNFEKINWASVIK